MSTRSPLLTFLHSIGFVLFLWLNTCTLIISVYIDIEYLKEVMDRWLVVGAGCDVGGRAHFDGRGVGR